MRYLAKKCNYQAKKCVNKTKTIKHAHLSKKDIKAAGGGGGGGGGELLHNQTFHPLKAK